jgi:hypothetical protein
MKPPILLTPDQVANILQLRRRKVLSLEIPKIRVGEGRGKILFNEDDVSDYLRRRTEYPVIKGDYKCGIPAKYDKSIYENRNGAHERGSSKSGQTLEASLGGNCGANLCLKQLKTTN